MEFPTIVKNIKYSIRNQLGRKVLWASRRKDLTIDKSTDLCVEGFPRSANTYSVLLIEKFAKRPLKIAHHLHIPSQIKKAIAWNIPAILLLREPAEAIPSLILREKGISITNALAWYNSFHSELLPYRDQVDVWNFKTLTQDPLSCLKDLNKRLDLWEIPDEFMPSTNEEIFHQIDHLDKETKAGHDLEMVNSRPNLKKSTAKKEIMDRITSHSRHSANMSKANQLFNSLMQERT